jgi:hypothetical protein
MMRTEPPTRVAPVKGEKCPSDVRLGKDNGTCCAERRDDLYSMGRSARGVFGTYGYSGDFDFKLFGWLVFGHVNHGRSC